MIEAKGVNGQVIVDGAWLTITRKGLGRVGHSRGDRRIPISSITAVQFRPPGAMSNGFVRFTMPGAPEARGGMRNSASDENAVVFTRKHTAEFERVRDAVEQFIAGQSAPPVASPANGGLAGQLGKLAELHTAGALSDTEYEAAKARILG